MNKIPEEGELVIIKIKKILPYGAFCTLEEYPNQEGFMHISEVASRWIKNIHEFLSEGKQDVAKITKVDIHKGQIDLSLKQVSQPEKKNKIETVRKTQRSNKLLEQVGKQTKTDTTKIKQELIDEYGDLYTALEEISSNGKKALEDLKFPSEFKKLLIKVSENAIKKPKAIIKGNINLTIYEADGLEIIKKTFKKIKSSKTTEIELNYVGAPKYELKIEAEDYKTAEKALEKIIKGIETSTKNKNVEFFFERKKG